MPGENAPPIWLFLSGIVAVGSVLAFLYFVTNDGAWADFVSWLLRKQRPGPFQQQAGMQDYDDDVEFPLSSVYERTDNVIPRPQRESAYQPRQMQHRHGVVGLYVPMVRTLPEQPKYDFLDDLLDLPTPPVTQQEAREVPFTPTPVYPPNMPTINLSDVAKADNVLVAGPKGSGKTTVLRTMLTVRTSEEMVALDPHASPGKWPCVVIGAGLEWDHISRGLRKMKTEMGLRFKQLARGEIKEGEFPRRSYVGDEFLSIVQELDGKDSRENAGKALISRITQGRKVGECILIASQNDTVEALGIKGNADLKGCFDYIIFLGSLVSTRANYHGCPRDVIAEAVKVERPAVVWNTNSNTWFLLVYDMKIVLEGEVLPGAMMQVDETEKDSPPNQPEPLRVLAEIARDYFDEQRVEEPEDVPEERNVYDNADLVRAAAYMANNPNPSQRELAKYLFGKNGGRWNVRAGLIMTEVRRLERKVENDAEDNNSAECEVGA